MQVHVLVIAGPATHLGDLIVHDGDDRMIRKPAALDAVIVDYITKSIFHSYPVPGSIAGTAIKAFMGVNCY